MNINTFKKNNSHIKNDESKTFFQLGNSMILGQKFDIKKYLNNINYKQNSSRKEKIIFPPLLDNLYKRTKNENKQYNLLTIDNSPIHRNILRKKKPSIDVSTSITYNISVKKNKNSSYTLNTINDNNSIINDLTLNKNSSIKTYFDGDIHSASLDLYNEEKYNFAKTIKNVKKKAELSKRDKSIKNIMENKIIYAPNNLDVIFRPIKIINDYQKYEINKLNNNRNDITTFITQKKDISKNNVLIKLLKNKKYNYDNTINERQKTIDNSRRMLDLYDNDFNNFKQNKKLAIKKLDDLHIKMILANRHLLKENYKLKSETRIKEDERQKYLERIDELRINAKFVSTVLKNNLDIFNKQIIPEYSSERLPNYEIIANELFEKFSFFLKEKEDLNPEDINILNQINQLNDTELLYNQFHKIEEDIINTLNKTEVIYKESIELKNEYEKHIKDIQKRIQDLKNELSLFKSIYEREKKDYEEIYKRNFTGDGEFDDLIKELYLDVMHIENNIKNKKNLININNVIIDLKNEIVGKEEKINKLQISLEQYERDDKNLFDRVVYHRRKVIREMKVNIKKKIIKVGEKEKIEHIRPSEKIRFIQRKCEPPYQPPKKDNKEVIDPEIIKNLENEELINYE